MSEYGSRVTAVLAAVLVLILAGGAATAYSVGRAQQGADQSNGTGDTDTGTPDHVIADDPDHDTTAAPTSDAPTSVVVRMSASAEASPHAAEVRQLIHRYFTAINRGNYDAWLTTVTTAQAQRDRDRWLRDYSTTHDTDIYISDIYQDPLTVRMQFVSHQDVEFAPADMPAECIRWDVTYYIIDEGLGLRVGTSAEPSSLAPCE